MACGINGDVRPESYWPSRRTSFERAGVTLTILLDRGQAGSGGGVVGQSGQNGAIQALAGTEVAVQESQAGSYPVGLRAKMRHPSQDIIDLPRAIQGRFRLNPARRRIES